MSRYLGQHFLKNQSAIKKIIAALELKSGDTVTEIGPGKGALTFPLLEECEKIGCKLVAVEKDPELAVSLELLTFRKNFKPEIEIIKDDILKILPELTKSYKLKAKSYKLVGNIPYYITGKLLRIMSELEKKPESIVLMIQKEVAERICAKPPRNNLLAAAVQFWTEPKILFTLKPNDFDPPPEVNSAVIKLTPITNKEIGVHPRVNPRLSASSYYKLIHIIFKQPRKTLINNLKDGLNLSKNEIENTLKTLKIDPKSRPQNLSLEDIQAIDKIL